MTQAIGVFDSGIGGLSVLRALRAELPREPLIYVADNGHSPYGEKDQTHVLSRSLAITEYLINTHQVKALVIACNTATAAAIATLRSRYPDLIIVGIEPALKPAAQHSKTKTVAVMATRSTLQSEKFRLLLASLQNQARFILQACDGLADAIERADAEKIEALCAQYTHALGTFGHEADAIDTVVLGCTHYPFIAPVLQRLIGKNITQIEGGQPVARQTRRLLMEKNQLLADSATAHTLEKQFAFYSTGNRLLLQAALANFLEMHTEVEALTV